MLFQKLNSTASSEALLTLCIVCVGCDDCCACPLCVGVAPVGGRWLAVVCVLARAVGFGCSLRSGTFGGVATRAKLAAFWSARSNSCASEASMPCSVLSCA